MLNIFQNNIMNIYGESGKKWLNQLPELIKFLSVRLSLSNLKEVENLTYNYVLSGYQENKAIILKLGFDYKALTQEAFSLKCFSGHGAVKILFESNGVLLLERAIPGTFLKDYFPNREKESMNTICNVIKKLHRTNIPKYHNFPHIKDWFRTLNEDFPIPNLYLQKARKNRDKLLKNSKHDILLHGDLHHDNILKNGNEYLIIDPKGVIGPPIFELIPFIINPIPDLLNHADALNIIFNRINYFSNFFGVSSQTILDWCFLKSVLSWGWNIQDKLDVTYFMQLTKIFDEGI